MAEEIGFENGRNSNFQGLVTLTLTLDPVIRHTVVHYSSTSTYTPNFIQIEETFCGLTDGRTDVRTDIPPPSNIIRSTFGSRPKKHRRGENRTAQYAPWPFSSCHQASPAAVVSAWNSCTECAGISRRPVTRWHSQESTVTGWFSSPLSAADLWLRFSTAAQIPNRTKRAFPAGL